MPNRNLRAIEVLVKFSRLVSGAEAPHAILPLLAEAALEHGGAAASAVVEVGPGGELRLAASRALPDDLRGWPGNVDAIGAELADGLLAASGGRFRRAFTLPLISGSDLFGALVVLHVNAGELGRGRRAILEALVDLSGTALGSAFQVAELSRSYAELRASRETLARAEKLRALGQMAAGVSHDIKNLLNPLSLHLQVIRRSLAKGDADVDESLAEMAQIVQRGVETVERIREFSRQAPERRVETVDVNHLVKEATRLARPRAPTQVNPVRIREELGLPPSVRLNGADFVGAVNNLIVNAIDALVPTGGTITVSTTEERDGAIIRIGDDGPGMPPDVEHRVFEPFFTTKGAEGTGLGLAMVYAFAQRHGGTITLDTALGSGATFTLWLPPC